MNAIVVPKSRSQNRLEGFALTAILQGFPVVRRRGLAAETRPPRHRRRRGVVRRADLGAPTACSRPGSRRNFPTFFRHGYEPLFFNASLSFAGKIAKWRERPTTSVQLVTSELMLALLAVAVVSMEVMSGWSISAADLPE